MKAGGLKLNLGKPGESKLKLGGNAMPKLGGNKEDGKPTLSLNLNKKDGETKDAPKFNFSLKKDGESKPGLSLGSKSGENKSPLFKLSINKKSGEGLKLGGGLSIGKKAIGSTFEIKFNFGTGKEFTGTTDPKAPFASGLSIGSTSLNRNTLNRANSKEKTEDGPVDDAESMACKVIDQGEEGEETLFNEKTQMLIYINTEEQKRWAERGCGNIHLNKGNGFYRLLLRRSETLKICLNVRLSKTMSFKNSRRDAVTFFCPYKFEEQKDAEEKISMIALRFKDEKTRDTFVTVANKIIAEL